MAREAAGPDDATYEGMADQSSDSREQASDSEKPDKSQAAEETAESSAEGEETGEGEQATEGGQAEGATAEPEFMTREQFNAALQEGLAERTKAMETETYRRMQGFQQKLVADYQNRMQRFLNQQMQQSQRTAQPKPQAPTLPTLEQWIENGGDPQAYKALIEPIRARTEHMEKMYEERVARLERRYEDDGRKRTLGELTGQIERNLTEGSAKAREKHPILKDEEIWTVAQGALLAHMQNDEATRKTDPRRFDVETFLGNFAKNLEAKIKASSKGTLDKMAAPKGKTAPAGGAPAKPKPKERGAYKSTGEFFSNFDEAVAPLLEQMDINRG